MSKTEEKKNVTDVNFEEVKDLEAEANAAKEEPEAEKKPIKDRIKSGLKTAGKIAGGFVLGAATVLAIGVAASKKDDEESDFDYNWRENDDEPSNEEED